MLLAVDAEFFRLDAVVRWLDAAEARVKRAAADGTMTWADQASPVSYTHLTLPTKA